MPDAINTCFMFILYLCCHVLVELSYVSNSSW